MKKLVFLVKTIAIVLLFASCQSAEQKFESKDVAFTLPTGWKPFVTDNNGSINDLKGTHIAADPASSDANGTTFETYIITKDTANYTVDGHTAELISKIERLARGATGNDLKEIVFEPAKEETLNGTKLKRIAYHSVSAENSLFNLKGEILVLECSQIMIFAHFKSFEGTFSKVQDQWAAIQKSLDFRCN